MLNPKQQHIADNPCLEIAEALGGDISLRDLSFGNREWSITCACCGGGGEHDWSPSGYSVDPDGGVYPCDVCSAEGQFHIVTEPKGGN